MGGKAGLLEITVVKKNTINKTIYIPQTNSNR